MQDGDSLLKWEARSWFGIYVGHSLVQAGNVPVLYNPVTTHISPQFHVVFDDQFTSVNRASSPPSEDFYKSLYEKAHWLYSSDMDASLDDYYIFDTYWMDPPISIKKQPIVEEAS